MVLVYGLLLFSACSSSSDNNNSDIRTVSDESYYNTSVSDTIILGFTLGMSEVDFFSWVNILKSNGNLYPNSSNDLTFELSDDLGSKLDCHLSPEFYDSKLVKLNVVAIQQSEIPSVKISQMTLVNLYLKKYGAPSQSKENAITNCRDYLWFNTKVRVTVHCGVADALVTYELYRKMDSIREREAIQSVDAI